MALQTATFSTYVHISTQEVRTESLWPIINGNRVPDIHLDTESYISQDIRLAHDLSLYSTHLQQPACVTLLICQQKVLWAWHAANRWPGSVPAILGVEQIRIPQNHIPSSNLLVCNISRCL